VKIALKKWTPRLGDLGDLGDTGQWRNTWPPTALLSLGESCDDPGVEHWRPCSEGGDLKVSKGRVNIYVGDTSRMNIIEHPPKTSCFVGTFIF